MRSLSIFLFFSFFLWLCINNHGFTPVHSSETLWRNSSVCVNVTTERNTVNWCAPQHRPCSQQPCVFLTGRQLCKREELKVVLFPEMQKKKIHAGTPSSDRWPSCLLMKIKAAQKCEKVKQKPPESKVVFLIKGHGLLLHV